MPNTHFAQVSQAQHVGVPESVHLIPLKLVGVIGLFQSERPGVSVLSKDHKKHIGISTGSCKQKGTGIIYVLFIYVFIVKEFVQYLSNIVR